MEEQKEREKMNEGDFDKKLMSLEGRVIDAINYGLNKVYLEIERLKSEIKAEHSELEEKLVKEEAKLRIYEAMFEKLNLNIELNPCGEEEE